MKATIPRREFVVGVPAVIGLAASAPLPAARPPVSAHYRLNLLSVRPLRFSVDADLPLKGERLTMPDSYPAELPEMAAKGWAALISDLSITDSSGRSVATAGQDKTGWQLVRPINGRVRLRYTVDFGVFQAAGWPSPLESAIVDDAHAVFSCRALFITTSAVAAATVTISCPRPWLAIAPWPAIRSTRQVYLAGSAVDLTDNMLVLSTERADTIKAAGFEMHIVTMGHWKPLRTLVGNMLQRIISLEVGMMGYRRPETYNVILVPTLDTGGEAYRQSFAYCFEKPTAENRTTWANTLAHEIFHYWNYGRLIGADYASTQWFQEGFTEYVANLVLLVGKVSSPRDFQAKLAGHIANYGRLSTTLEAIGTHKGPPLYSAGALVAFNFDVMIRSATDGQRTLGTFFRNLWRVSDGGGKKYAWAEINTALRATAPGDWQRYYARYIRGAEHLPIGHALELAGLRLGPVIDGTPQVVLDPEASARAKAVWLGLNSKV